jgi:hypothetical protein
MSGKLQWRSGWVELAGQRIKAEMAQVDPTFYALRYPDGRIGFYSTMLDAQPQDPKHTAKKPLPISNTMRPVTRDELRRIAAKREFDNHVADIRFKMSRTPAQPTPQAITPSPFHKAGSDISTIVMRR